MVWRRRLLLYLNFQFSQYLIFFPLDSFCFMHGAHLFSQCFLLQDALIIHIAIIHFHPQLLLNKLHVLCIFLYSVLSSDSRSFSCKNLCLTGTYISPTFVIMIMTLWGDQHLSTHLYPYSFPHLSHWT